MKQQTNVSIRPKSIVNSSYLLFQTTLFAMLIYLSASIMSDGYEIT
jgi:hypothetical protein